MKTKPICVFLMTMIFFLVGCEIGAHQRYIASQIEGHILNNKKPVSGATIIREITIPQTDKKWIQEATSDAEGYFKLDEITEKGYLKILGTTAYKMNLSITHQNKKLFDRIWYKTDASLRFADAREAKDFLTKGKSTLTFLYDIAQ